MDENGRGFLLILRGDLVKKVKSKEGEEGGLFRPGFSGYFFFHGHFGKLRNVRIGLTFLFSTLSYHLPNSSYDILKPWFDFL